MTKGCKTKKVPKKDIIVKVCVGTGGLAAGGDIVLMAFKDDLEKRGISASVEPHCAIHQVGCRGLCARDVLVDVIVNNEKVTYQYIKPQMVQRIVNEHIIEGNIVQDWIVGEEYHDFYKKQLKLVLSRCGFIDPEDIEAYIATGGYRALKKALYSMTRDEVLEEVKRANLRGRGGAGFPAGRKWEHTRKSPGEIKYIVANGDEGDPGAFMDRAIMEGDPHSLIEGMLICAYAIGAQKGFIYVRQEYPLALERLKKALKQAREKGFLGKGILGKDFDFDIRLKLGAGAFVCGEATALVASIEGKRGFPRARPPRLSEPGGGLWGHPTNLNNVETLACVPLIIDRGADYFLSIGTENSPGTKVFSLTGRIKNTGLIEVPMGITLREIIYDIGGGILGDRKFKAVQTGGPSGGCIPSMYIDLPVDFDSLTAVGSMMGSGGMVVLDETDCMVNIARFFLEFTQSESCGKCVPCRIGTKRLLEILQRITAGKGKSGDIELLESLSHDVKASSLCGLGQTAPNPVLSTIKYFRDEYEAHIHDLKCPAGVCKDLLTYFIIEDSCTGCLACLRACPAGAITGERKQLHKINQDLCIKCGACLDVCKFKAVEKE